MSTYQPIASVTLSSAQSSVTFSGIPQTYTDLVIVNSTISGNGSANLTVNGDTGSNYSRTFMYGDGSSAASGRSSNASSFTYTVGGTTNVYSATILNLMNYANATTHKTFLLRGNDPSGATAAHVGLWRNTAAITSATITCASGNFPAGSTFNIYGVNAQASAQAKAYGGDSITTDGTYWYHTFYSSGTFTPTQALTADYLVVAGGGAGGFSQGYSGGGGAGGYRTSIGGSALSLIAQAYAVTVGAGGAVGSSGSDSIFSTITSTGGGRAGGYNGSAYVPALDGGSGGGGGFNSSATRGLGNTPSTSPSQGNNGGANGDYNSGGGGGGGAGAAGAGAGGNSAAGGVGVSNSISGSAVFYAGGGGGGRAGAGGNGGGGSGTNSSAGGTAGTANTGGGGGGGYEPGPGGAGGSGIVIVRYAI